jgi:hypothetical protein
LVGFQRIDAGDHAIADRELDHTGVPLRFGSATIRFPIAADALPTLRRTTARSLKLLLELTCRWADYVHNPDSGKSGVGDCAVGIAIQVSLALWIMIGCLAMEAVQLAQYFD